MHMLREFKYRFWIFRKQVNKFYSRVSYLATEPYKIHVLPFTWNGTEMHVRNILIPIYVAWISMFCKNGTEIHVQNIPIPVYVDVFQRLNARYT